MSARKRRHRRIAKRIERHRFRRAEKRMMQGGKLRNGRFGTSWNGVPGMRGRDLP
jgi:hypothetical protein